MGVIKEDLPGAVEHYHIQAKIFPLLKLHLKHIYTLFPSVILDNEAPTTNKRRIKCDKLSLLYVAKNALVLLCVERQKAHTQKNKLTRTF